MSEQILEILKFAVPTAITATALIYAIKQRSIAKKEQAKKTYLEKSLNNLNDTIELLRKVEIPPLSALFEDAQQGYAKYSDWEEAIFGTYMLTDDILRASFDMKTKKINLVTS